VWFTASAFHFIPAVVSAKASHIVKR